MKNFLSVLGIALIIITVFLLYRRHTRKKIKIPTQEIPTQEIPAQEIPVDIQINTLPPINSNDTNQDFNDDIVKYRVVDISLEGGIPFVTINGYGEYINVGEHLLSDNGDMGIITSARTNETNEENIFTKIRTFITDEKELNIARLLSVGGDIWSE